MYPWVI